MTKVSYSFLTRQIFVEVNRSALAGNKQQQLHLLQCLYQNVRRKSSHTTLTRSQKVKNFSLYLNLFPVGTLDNFRTYHIISLRRQRIGYESVYMEGATQKQQKPKLIITSKHPYRCSPGLKQLNERVVQYLGRVEDQLKALKALYENYDNNKRRSLEYANLCRRINKFERILTARKEQQDHLNTIEDLNQLVESEKDDIELMNEVAIELDEYKKSLSLKEENILKLLVADNDEDDCDCIVEIRQAAGGDEASIFVQDIAGMYELYCVNQSLKIKMLSKTDNDVGSKEIVLSIQGKNAYETFKHEGGKV